MVGTATSLAVGDIDGDLRPDVVTGDANANSLSVMRNACR